MSEQVPQDIYRNRDQMLYEIHSDLKHLLKSFDAHLIDDALQVKRLEQMEHKMTEHEVLRGIHSKFIWCTIPVVVGLAVKSVWDLITKRGV